ncbi:hypothetical protein QVD17_02206 [Tagetes erecta]|uniref:Uncharacterized protein n=1 Tax=Tagetes erecta TaxID=13708 RepID=A0AAD8P8Y7_TARER|nr:hypothetical protein QVD17_02206 [Tagetes erecta]
MAMYWEVVFVQHANFMLSLSECYDCIQVKLTDVAMSTLGFLFWSGVLLSQCNCVHQHYQDGLRYASFYAQQVLRLLTFGYTYTAQLVFRLWYLVRYACSSKSRRAPFLDGGVLNVCFNQNHQQFCLFVIAFTETIEN